MNKFLNILIFLSSTALLSCGFKVVNQSEINNFDIMEITTSGNKSINYKIKNNLLNNSKSNNKKLVKIFLDTNKTKKIKEKNIKNEITKYEILISVKVKVETINDQKSIDFSVLNSGDYNINTKHSVSLRNEKKLIDLLTDELSNEIINEIVLKINDL